MTMPAMRRPTPYTPLSVTFATGQTGTAILDEYGLEGLAVWAAMLAAAKYEEGLIVFRHEDDWGAIGLATHAPEFTLNDFLTFLGRRKQTRKTRQGRVLYVELRRWSEWNDTRQRQESNWRKARSRQKKKRDNNVTPAGQQRDTDRDSRARGELELDNPPIPPQGGKPATPTKKSNTRSRYTGCRYARGTHSSGYVHDVLGTAKPPPDWPYPRPTADEVKTALNGRADEEPPLPDYEPAYDDTTE